MSIFTHMEELVFSGTENELRFYNWLADDMTQRFLMDLYNEQSQAAKILVAAKPTDVDQIANMQGVIRAINMIKDGLEEMEEELKREDEDDSAGHDPDSS